MYNLLGDPAIVLARPDADLTLQRTGDRWNPQVAIRLPAANFGGNVDVDWIDAKGRRIVSRQYEARDRQFLLAIPDKAAELRVYTTDTRNGSTAFGALKLLEPPPPPPAPPLPKPRKIQTPPQRPQATAAAVARRPVDPRDRVSEMDFESSSQPPPRVDADRREPNTLR